MRGSKLEQHTYTREALGFPINVALSGCGNDTLIKITGGCAPHIGSVSVAYLDSGEPALRTLLLPGHRDDVVSDMFAEAIAKKLGATVTVVCGIHYEEPGKEGIETILERTRSLLDEVINSI